jgi:hypothetical protein
MSKLNFVTELVNGGADAELTYGLQHSEHMPSWSTAPYDDGRTNRCAGKDNTCMAYSTKDSRETHAPLCVGCGRADSK